MALVVDLLMNRTYETNEIAMLDPSILREYDIRGIVGDTLTGKDVYLLGRGFGSIVFEEFGANSKVVVSCDGRLSSPELILRLIEGLTSTGVNVINIGLGPTPMLYFYSFEINASGAMMITGSHNPPDYNGIKLVLANRPFYGKKIQELAQRIHRDQFASGAGTTTKIDIRDQYVERVLRENQWEGNIKVAWDPGNGAAGEVVRKITNQLNGQHYIINEEIDGRFPNHHPDPTIENNLVQLKEAVNKNGCDLGIGFDGDGDRIGVVDTFGRVLYGDQLMVVWARDILERFPGSTIISEVKASKSFYDEVKKAGGDALMWKTGHSLIKAKMSEIKAPLAGEMSGHIFFADEYYGFDDALYAALRLLRILVKTDQRLDEIYDSLPRFYNTPEVRIDCGDEKKFIIIDEIRNRLRLNKDLKIYDIDGVRVETNDGWWLLRASNTQPALVARCESNTKTGFALVKRQISEQLDLSGIKEPIFD